MKTLIVSHTWGYFEFASYRSSVLAAELDARIVISVVALIRILFARPCR